MKKITMIFALLWVVLLSSSCFSQEKDSKVKWMGVSDAINQAQKDGKDAKLIFIDCYTDWCKWCKVLDRKSFSEDTVAAILNYYYYPCKFDAEGQEPITINEVTYNPVKKGERKGTHELMKTIWEGQKGGGYPTMSIRKSDFSPVDCILGYVEASELQKALVYYAEGYNKDMSFEKFSDKYADKYQAKVIKKIFKK